MSVCVCVCVCVYLGELALLVDERDDVHGFDGDHVQSVLVVGELDVLPVDVLQVVLLLLQLEDVTHEELLQVLVGEVDAQLLEAAGGREVYYLQPCAPMRPSSYREEFSFCVCVCVCVVPVDREVLKAEDVQQSDGASEDFGV